MARPKIAGTMVRGSTITDAIIGKRCRIEQCRLDGALLGDDVTVRACGGARRWARTRR